MKYSILFTAVILILTACQPAILPTNETPTTTPEIFIPVDKAISDYGIVLEGVHLSIADTTLSDQFPAGCTGMQPACVQAGDGSKILSVTFVPRDLPDGNMLAYKNLPAVNVVLEGDTSIPFSQSLYNNANHNLTVGFEVPASAKTFGLKWGDLVEIPLSVNTQ
ncbi:MAG: hypothetical protein M1282_01545 [Chloroflexi bacterium]|nr:hypothetical protein [Chloroflexota bacterium]